MPPLNHTDAALASGAPLQEFQIPTRSENQQGHQTSSSYLEMPQMGVFSDSDAIKHEIGHVFGLPHVDKSSNLMCGATSSSGFSYLWDVLTQWCTDSFSADLDVNQAAKARTNAAKLSQ